MKPSEARRRWFEILDDVAAGEEVVIERNGRRIVMRAEDPGSSPRTETPDYSDVLRFRSLDDADAWHWEWTEKGLKPQRSRRK
jgi:antitoxin (DNA-binding transcriptional repressor) of toxin-antitoxin stability system